MVQEKYVKELKQYESLNGWEKLTFGQQLKKWADKYGNKVAMSEGDYEITYEELDHTANEIAYKLLETGIKKKDHVIVQLPNRISFVVITFALARIGAVPIMAFPAHREAELSGMIELAKPVAYIAADKYLGFHYKEMAERLKQKYSCLKTIIIDEGNEFHKSRAVPGCCLIPRRNPQTMLRQLSEMNSYQMVMLLLSGGTTGIPKLIPRTHADYMYGARKAAQRCNLNEKSVFLAVLPVPHNFTLGNPGILGTLMNGGKVVMAPSTSPDDVFALIEKHHVTEMALVPSLVSLYLETLEGEDSYDISNLQAIWVGGAMFEEKTARRVGRKFHCKLQQVFGTAEGLNCYTSLEDSEDIVCTCQGKPLSEVDEMKIVDEDGNEVEPGCYGELLARGPYTIDGYYDLPEVNKVCFTEGGYYKTGDRAMITPEGNLRMGGRIKEQINRAGEKIMPAEIEGYLCQYKNILEAAVVGVPDDELGHRSCAFVLTKEGENVKHKKINQYLKELGVAEYKFPDQVEQIDSWPVTSVGKIDKKVLVKMAARG